MKRFGGTLMSYGALAIASSMICFAYLPAVRAQQAAGTGNCPADAAGSGPIGVTLSPGFCATVFADKLGHVRHLAVASDGTVYANSWSGRYYHGEGVLPGGFLLRLKDTKGSGKADAVDRFGATEQQGAAGGTGVAVYKNAIYSEEADKIIRYDLPADGSVPQGKPEVVLSGMPLTGDHPMHPFVIDRDGHIFVDMGSATNSCQPENRVANVPGAKPCKELETRGGTWRYDANKTGQHFSAKERYATGIRNGEGYTFDASGQLYVTQHGRDQLGQNWSKFYNSREGAELPAEEVVKLQAGGDYGWPECYFDGARNSLMLAPEYGGDGKTVGECANKLAPVAAFPAHWAPNDMAFSTGAAFPKAYQGGVFIAFHGSWNRAPAPQGGYNVVYQPFADGKPAGDYIVFADGFAGANKEPGRATYRPSGLAVGPDGALYIGDDVQGRIWRITYKGDVSAALKVAAAPAPAGSGDGAAGAVPPEGSHVDAGRTDAALSGPPGVAPEQMTLGNQIFHGEAKDGTCSGCHGSDGKGTTVGPNLTSGDWLWADGSLASIVKVVKTGVEHPKKYTGMMPPKGGADLTDADVDAVSAYVWALGHQKKG